MSKHIFVTGGVVSSLGKGLTSGAIGLLLEGRGLKVAMQKLDPYINVDPGTMSPYQHGEVYVTADGAETDLDLGHYERFTNAKVNRFSNYTTGRIYQAVIQKERQGEYLGNTVQVVPHITDEIKAAIRSMATPDVDVVITEIGGTVGDIESLPFLEAIRQFGQDVGRENACYVHLTLVPYLKASQEIKTKPTQHSVGKLREIGIQPDFLICRTEQVLEEDVKRKIGLFCNLRRESVIEEKDVDFSIYEVPLVLREQQLDALIVKHLGLKGGAGNIAKWEAMLAAFRAADRTVEVAMVGKYIEHQDAYKSVYESLTHAGIAHGVHVKVRRVEAEQIEARGAEACLKGVSGILVPGGFGLRGSEGKILAARYARERRIPYFGLCLGMQIAAIEIARDVCGLQGANSSEFDGAAAHPVIALMDSQRQVTTKGGTMRLGSYPCVLTPGSRAAAAYGPGPVDERHRHRYEFNNAYRERFEAKGVVFSGQSPDGKLVEILELKDHPWFLATQFHPEFQSRPTRAHPLFAGFVEAVVRQARGAEVKA